MCFFWWKKDKINRKFADLETKHLYTDTGSEENMSTCTQIEA